MSSAGWTSLWNSHLLGYTAAVLDENYLNKAVISLQFENIFC